ncbi:COG4223 family protein [Alloyangia pacifica]|uniref:COG4223 family protein n=1 Tax=Alloyangia pacifica TaxID=311180 RepID=UPI0015A26DDB|nr:hypothetical protein [Alloyangia pacifica]
MADKKKPLDAKKQPDGDKPEEGKVPGADPAGTETPDTGKPETGKPETGTLEAGATPEEASDQDAPDSGMPETVPADAEDTLGDEVKNAAGAENLEAEDTLAKEDAGDETPGEGDTLMGAEGTDTLSTEDSLASAEADDTFASEPANSMESIHSVGEAVELDSEADVGKDADTLIAEGDDTVAAGPDTAGPVVAGAAVPMREVVRETVVERKGGFVPVALGGIVAAALGWGASSYQSGSFPFGDGGAQFEAETSAALAAQSEQIDTLNGTVAETAAQVGGIDLSGLESSAADLGARMQAAEGSAATLTEQVAQLQTRIEDMQNQWLSESVSPEAMAAYEKALADVRTAIETQRAEVEQMTQEAMQAREAASDQAMVAESRSALADVETALRDGAPYAAAIQTMQENGVDVPGGLSDPAGDGVPTLSALEAEFPPAARDALSAARRAESTNEDTASRVTTFFANQLGARSVEPRAGDDPDAVLSRAEAALRSGDLGTVLSELAALPEPAQAELADWIARAETRKAALDGADAVAQTLNQN